MKITTKGRYGTRAMIDIALHTGEGMAHVADIAARQGVSRKYLESIVSKLEAARLVRTCRGAGGGVRIAREPSTITLGEILAALEGPLEIVECVLAPERCPRTAACASRDVWVRLADHVRAFLDATTLESLCAEQRAKDAGAAVGACLPATSPLTDVPPRL